MSVKTADSGDGLSTGSDGSSRRRAQRCLRGLVAVAAGLLAFLLLEGLLGVTGVNPLAREDPFVGFKGSLPLFVSQQGPDDAPVGFVLNPAKERYFNPQSFRMPKPAGTFRIISFGGSTTYGRPYLDDTAFPTWTAGILRQCDPEHRYESINAGGISYASYRVLRLMGELARFDPDLYVVYSGHNEFLERRTFGKIIDENPAQRRLRSVFHRSRVYSALYRMMRRIAPASAAPARTVVGNEVDALIEEVGGPELYHDDPAFREGVIGHYRHTVSAMAEFCRREDVPLILCTVPSNLSGVSPFKSEHRPGLTPTDLKGWEAAFGEGQAALRAGLYDRALASLERAERIDDEFALLHFLKGRSLAGLSRHDQAYAAFNRAKERDIVPLRALDAFNAAIRETARREEIPLADVEALFRAVSPNGIPGPELFIDHVHPTIRGQQLIGRLVAETAVAAGMAPVTGTMWDSGQARVRGFLDDALSRITPRYEAMGYWGVGRLFYWAGKYPEAYEALVRSWEEVRDIPELALRLGELEMHRGNPLEAAVYLRHAAGLDPGDPAIALALANAHLMVGEGEDALALLDRLADVEGSAPGYHLARAEAFRLTGRPLESSDEVGLAVGLAPEVPGVRQAAAMAWLRLGDRERAAAEYAEYLRLSRHPDPRGALAQWMGQEWGEEP